MRTSRFALIAGVGIAASVQVAHADVIMSNLAFADDAGGTAFGPGSTTEFKAYGWTMPDQAYFLDNVTLLLAAFNTGEARVSIWGGDTTPQNELLVLDAPAGPGAGYHNVAFTPGAPFTLEASTTYWVYVEPLGGGGDGFLWGDTTPSTAPSGIGTSVGYIFNGNPSTFRNVVEINGTLVPSPGALGLLTLGAAAVGRRRRPGG